MKKKTLLKLFSVFFLGALLELLPMISDAAFEKNCRTQGEFCPRENRAMRNRHQAPNPTLIKDQMAARHPDDVIGDTNYDHQFHNSNPRNKVSDPEGDLLFSS